MRVCRTCSVFFLSVKKRREKILCVSLEPVLYFFLAGEISMRDRSKTGGSYSIHCTKSGRKKEGFQNRVFEKRGGGKSRAAVLLLLLLLYIYSIIVIVVDRNTRFFCNFFILNQKNFIEKLFYCVLRAGARGNHPYSGGEVTIVRTPPIRVMLHAQTQPGRQWVFA
jgi:hypothetical protein